MSRADELMRVSFNGIDFTPYKEAKRIVQGIEVDYLNADRKAARNANEAGHHLYRVDVLEAELAKMKARYEGSAG